MSKACFDKLDPKPPLIIQCTYRVNGADDNTLGLLGTTSCTLEFPKMFQEQFIVCEHLLRPISLGLDFSHNYLIISLPNGHTLPYLHKELKGILIGVNFKNPRFLVIHA